MTVVIPVYNSGKYLNRLFSALDGQTFKDFSVIIVYDESSDNTFDILELNQIRDYPVSILQKKKKEGVGAARDYAIDSGAINSTYVWFLDADDFPHKDFLAKMVASSEQNNSSISICGFNRIDGENGHIIAREMVSNPNLVSNLADNTVIPLINPAPWNKLFRMDVIKDARFIYPGGTGEDTLFLLKVLPNCRSISFVNEVLYNYYVNLQSAVSNTNQQLLEVTKSGYIETKVFFETHGETYAPFMPLLVAFVFLRLGIGATTRACLTSPKDKAKIIKSTKSFLDSNFPTWEKNRYWSFSSCVKKGLKGIMIWRCRYLYKIGLFGIFVREYGLFSKLFKKDIRW